MPLSPDLAFHKASAEVALIKLTHFRLLEVFYSTERLGIYTGAG